MEKRLIDGLIKTVGKENVLNTPEDLAVYSYDGTFVESQPEVIVLPGTTDEVSQVVKLAAEDRVAAGAARDGIRAGRRLNPITRRGYRDLLDPDEPYPGNRHRKCHRQS